ncbi:HVO_0416 family zinc finger protein [Halobacteriaceae archaeon GCM10025711]
MSTALDPDDTLFDQFLTDNGHEQRVTWDRSYNKKQCPECGGLHEMDAATCSVCGWAP